MSLKLTRCGCGAEIYFLTFVKSGKLGPIDAAPSPEGNCLINGAEGTYTVLVGPQLREAREGSYGPDGGPMQLHTSHFKTCPNRDSFGDRKAKQAGPERPRRRPKPIVGDQLAMTLEEPPAAPAPPRPHVVDEGPWPCAGGCGQMLTRADIAAHVDRGRFCVGCEEFAYKWVDAPLQGKTA